MNRISLVLIASLAASSIAGPSLARSNQERPREAQTQTTKQHRTQRDTQRQASPRKAPNTRHTRHVERSGSRVVNDWHKRGLKRPSKGQVYVERNGDIFLVAAATLLIHSIINR